MTRIISGAAGGRRLATPAGSATRPTSDRVREALFSRLEHLDVLAGARVLDLYAGSGALALEALSRGARAAVLVDSDRSAVKAARANSRALGFAERVEVRRDTVERVLLGGPAGPGGPGGPEHRFDLVVLDPPYELDEQRLADVLALLVLHAWLAADALVVLERSGRSPQPMWPSGLEASGERRYGETRMWFADAPGPDEVA
ncbi:MAG: 16S rRNA (guanine(966)-N(2))-methyltransferase RsmD [Candidatus Phosphoribacter sp.]|nr:16S rRNA (guanine(966)-N(2))-methyltransferase RsmD [Actinomycetales bacterium]